MKNEIYAGSNLKPINAVAARVVTQKGIRFVSKKKINQLHWSVPPPIQKVHPGLVDLTGKKFGRFEVVGKYGKWRDGTLWLVRCSCGDYETRKGKSVINPKNTEDCCDQCRHLIYLKTKKHL